AGHRQLAPAVSAPAAPAAMSKPVPVAPEQPLRFPKLVASSAAGRLLDSKKPFELHSPQAAVPEFRTPNRNAVIIEPIAAIPLTAPEPAAEAPPAGISDCGLRPIAYYCHRGEPTPRCECASMAPSFRPTLPRLAVRPIFDRQEEFTSQRTIEKKPTFAEILSLPEAVALRKRSALVRHGAAAIAASLAVAFGLWVGIGATRLRTQALNRDASEIAAAIKPSGSATPTGPAAHGVSGALAWVKTAAAKRAAVELNDGFQQGMQAWSGAGKGWAPGWSRNPDGYVRLGQLALFRPSLNYSDYRMEFLGQIESKGMGWVVRAHDSQNYYAMKFNVVQPGLRPILSMVHYPVVAGKKGHKIETPLSVMIHNDTPYHVLVEVHGNRFTTSIEGQEVDSWTDEALAAGGVGFFSDAGEHARLYWMKLYKNDDWLGRICAYLAGGSDAPKDTAWLERPGLPTPAPERREVPCPQAAILAGETGDLVFSDSQRPGVSTGRNNKWKS
ncbi:MAG TPA: hypothetical protein VJ732_13115, partial [Bryobacteraceae bacterium]|nr:hypothetical protein [Bryobacteraceae bacterium]